MATEHGATEAEWDALGRYVDRIRDALLLGHWRLTIGRDLPDALEGDDPVEQDAIDGQIKVETQGYVATLRLHRDYFATDDRDLQRHIIVHELLHLHLDHVFEDQQAAIDGFASAQSAQAARVLMVRAYERMTDLLASAVAPHLPLPELPGHEDDNVVS